MSGGQWTLERRERMRDLHRQRAGAPPGFCTVHGLHVPAEHRGPVRYFADAIASRWGADRAAEFVKHHLSTGWAEAANLHDLWARKLEIRRTRKMIRQVQWEAYRANQDRR